MSPGPKVYDAAVIGAGLSGLAMAVALAGPAVRVPLQVLLLDAGDPRDYRYSAFDGRASAVTLTSRRMLEALDLWGRLEANAQAMNEIIVTDSTLDAPRRPVLLHFGDETAAGGPTAWMVENRHLYAALYDAAEAAPDIAILSKSRVEEFQFARPSARLHLGSGEIVETRLVVAADGRGSLTGRAAGIETFDWAYDQTAIVATVEHDKDHGGRAEEHFLPAGPFAILPLTGRRSSLVWSEEPGEAERIIKLDEDAFLDELKRRFGEHLGEVRPVGPRHAYQLSMHLAKSFIGPRLALIGDAAHVVHPIAGLGFNLALRDIAALTETLSDAVRLGLDHGGPATLERYQAWRRLDTVTVALMTDGLNRLFSNDVAPLRLVRDLGLTLVDRAGPLKGFFMREAAGLTGRLPKLLNGEPV